MRATLALALFAALALAAGCAPHQPTGPPVLVDPSATRQDVGGSDDVMEVAQRMVSSMRRDPEVLAKPSKLILLDQQSLIIDPKLRGYNARLLYNDFTAKLNRAAGGEFRFIDRAAVQAERERQLRGEVKTSGVDAAPAGADMVLIALQGGSTTTVQYNFKLTGLDGVDLWMDNHTIVKRS
jgi:PBP1b-binding outer membrane lipoprotein LpoB